MPTLNDSRKSIKLDQFKKISELDFTIVFIKTKLEFVEQPSIMVDLDGLKREAISRSFLTQPPTQPSTQSSTDSESSYYPVSSSQSTMYTVDNIDNVQVTFIHLIYLKSIKNLKRNASK